MNKTKRRHYPFSAVIGQEDLKLCLLLCAIDPSIGGVLIKGEKGTAKSTAARGIARLMPKIEVGCDMKTGIIDAYNRSPRHSGAVGAESSSDRHAEDNDDKEEDTLHDGTKHIETPFVDFPIGATEDRVVGSIDFSETLKQGGKPVFSPGLLAASNRGVLYIDEVNLLPAHLVDIILDSAAMGINTVQREGITMTHPAKFMPIGTMNPEEGNLRPQLLDRFGLMVEVSAPKDAKLRSEVVRQRIAFEMDEGAFAERWKESETDLAERILAAKDRLPEVVLTDDLLLLISQICTDFQVGTLRADITLYKAARALAAWNGRVQVDADDIRQAAKWVLAHRLCQQPFESQQQQPDIDRLLDERKDENDQNKDGDQDSENWDDPGKEGGTCDQTEGDENEGGSGDQMQTFTASKPGQIKQIKLSNLQSQNTSTNTGKRNSAMGSKKKAQYTRSIQTDAPVGIALDATLRAAASNGLSKCGQPVIRPENWRKKLYKSTTDTVILFVVDSSGSMSARKRMEAVKGAVLLLLTDAYQQRDRVGVISFRGVKAEILLEPTRSIDLASKQLQRLPTGGRTPLAHALSLTHDTVQRLKRNQPDQGVLVIVLSDGKGNVPLPNSQGCDPWSQTEHAASKLEALSIPTLMLDTDAGHVRVGRGKELAEILNAEYMLLDELSSDGLFHTIKQLR
mmetsp:Transcript_40653/g.85390  ORF Transcript_40653/g.85390 Transcript_40653/m.85390 type:complete len:681 (-) Transcript_40653:230-2272(-)